MYAESTFDVLPTEQAYEGEEVLGEILAGLFPKAGPVQSTQLEAAWDAVDEGSWHELGASEDSGGFALTLRDLGLFATAVGRTLAPVPLVQAWALTEKAGTSSPTTIAIPRAGRPGRLRVPDALFPGVEVVNAQLELPVLEGLSADPYPRVSELAGDAGAVDPRLLERLCVLWAAEAVGAVGPLVDDAVAYALAREQFGQPIGKLQSVKHMVARAEWLRQEALTALVWAASGDPDTACLELLFGHCVSVSEIVGQVHGGIGMTWELGHHYATRRIITLRGLVRDIVAWKE